MTDKQWRMLDVLDHWGGMGTIEVTINFGEYDYGDSEAEEAKGWRITNFVVQNMIRSLVKKGYASDDENGYDITEKGRELLAKHRERTKKGG